MKRQSTGWQQNKLVGLLIALIILLLHNSTSAAVMQTESATLAFRNGIFSFQQHDYTNALAFFYKAKELGFNKSSLFYNIGVCHYKLGQYQKAEAAFKVTARSPNLAPLAFYNMALIAIAEGDDDKALTLLEKVLNHTEDIKLRALAVNALDVVQQRLQKKMFIYGSIAIGYDDNVILTAASDTIPDSGMEDAFTEFSAFTGGPILGGNYHNGMQYTAGAFFLKYFDFTSYDTGTINLGSSYKKTFSSWLLEVGGNYSFTILDGRQLEQAPYIEMTAIRTLPRRHSLRLHYQLGYFDMLHQEYEFLTGWQHKAMIGYILPSSKTKTRLSYSIETNDRQDDEASPTRHQLQLKIEYYMLSALIIYGDAAYRTSRYDLTTSVDRSDDRYLFTGGLRYKLARQWELNCEYRHTDNQSNYAEFDYKRNVILLSLAHYF